MIMMSMKRSAICSPADDNTRDRERPRRAQCSIRPSGTNAQVQSLPSPAMQA